MRVFSTGNPINLQSRMCCEEVFQVRERAKTEKKTNYWLAEMKTWNVLIGVFSAMIVSESSWTGLQTILCVSLEYISSFFSFLFLFDCVLAGTRTLCSLLWQRSVCVASCSVSTKPVSANKSLNRPPAPLHHWCWDLGRETVSRWWSSFSGSSSDGNDPIVTSTAA